MPTFQEYWSNPEKHKEKNRIYNKENRERFTYLMRLWRAKHKNDKDYQLRQRWGKMKQRCLNKNNPKYDSYGGRGIKICVEWMDFKNFEKDMEKTFNPILTLDRINNNGNYCKENCRWTDKYTQANNTRKNRIIKYQGETKTFSQWCRYFRLNIDVIFLRFHRLKWPIEKCFEYKEVSDYA